jgi:hypothetical protein
MGQRVRVAAALLLAVAAGLAALPATTTANKVTINWKPNVNYTNWTDQHRPFYKGDWLGTHILFYSTLPATPCLPPRHLLPVFPDLMSSPGFRPNSAVFYYTPGQADVVQVDAAGYNKCDSSNAIYNYSKGRSFAFQLNETKTYYFICSYGYCYGGMRLAIRAEKLPPPSPPPSAHRSGAAFAWAHAPPVLAAAAVLAALLGMV